MKTKKMTWSYFFHWLFDISPTLACIFLKIIFGLNLSILCFVRLFRIMFYGYGVIVLYLVVLHWCQLSNISLNFIDVNYMQNSVTVKKRYVNFQGIIRVSLSFLVSVILYRAACAWGQWSLSKFVSDLVSGRSRVKLQNHAVKCNDRS